MIYKIKDSSFAPSEMNKKIASLKAQIASLKKQISYIKTFTKEGFSITLVTLFNSLVSAEVELKKVLKM